MNWKNVRTDFLREVVDLKEKRYGRNVVPELYGTFNEEITTFLTDLTNI